MLAAAGPRAVMDGVHCQDEDVVLVLSSHGSMETMEEKQEGSRAGAQPAEGVTTDGGVPRADIVIAAAAAAAAATAPEAVATPAAAATTATVGHLVSCRQGDGKHNPQPSLRRCSKGSHARWYNRSVATTARQYQQQQDNRQMRRSGQQHHLRRGDRAAVKSMGARGS